MQTHSPEDLGEQLVGLTEIGNLIGVTNRAVSNWTWRHEDFPQPIVRLSFGPVFWKPEVEQWLIKTGRLVIDQGSYEI